MNGGAYPYMQTNAISDHRFTATDTSGATFVWDDSTATFNIDFTGVNSISSSDGSASSGALVLNKQISYTDPQAPSFDVDLSHTLTTGYSGPDRGITTSDSGTLALLGLALLILGLLRRRKAILRESSDRSLR
jgi:hypothetical protein